ncbi:MAG: hypothetical protein ACP5GJ_03485 [Nanopusillaceae archaeon]|jgi:hypothetical protein
MRFKYILPIIFSILGFSIFSQPPIWQTVSFNTPSGQSVTIPLYMTQLVYQVNITPGTSLQYVQITIPQSILQQELQYCKTYDSFIANNISVLQCAYAYPSIAVVYNNPYSNPPSMANGNSYEIPYYMDVLSYDNVTGLPQTFQIFINNYVGTLSAGTYYIYVYYGGPYYMSLASVTTNSIPSCPSVSSLPYATTSNFDGGWCGSNGGASFPGYSKPWGQAITTTGGGSFTITRYLYVTFNPQYPVLVGYQRAYCASGCSDSGSVTVENPSTSQTQTLSINGGVLYDLRILEQQNGLDPDQWNEIVNVSLSASHPAVYCWYSCEYAGSALPGFYLLYTPQT